MGRVKGISGEGTAPDPSHRDFGPATEPIEWERLIGLLHSYQRFALTTHIRPDCDALGSVLALSHILEHLGKRVRIVNAFEVPPNLKFVDSHGKLHTLDEPESQEWLGQIDVLIVVDTSAWAQLGRMADIIRSSDARKIIIDHHVTGDDLGAEVFRDPHVEATGRLIWELAQRLGVPQSADFAQLIFLAVATDTGWFRFSSTSAATYRLAADLVALGVRPDQIYRQLYETESPARLRLVGRALQKLEVEQEGRLVYTSLERRDFDATGALASDSEDIINTMLTIDGAEVAVMFIEQPSGALKVSLRSRSKMDCAQVAAQFGGGGHRNASGILFNPPFVGVSKTASPEQCRETLAQLVLDAVRRAME